jgi:hypothetical protein
MIVVVFVLFFQNKKIDGNWADWFEWSACDVTCDVGIHIRKRTCTNPAPAYQGLMCSGNDTETKRCNIMLCPGKDFRRDYCSCDIVNYQ